MLSRKVAIARVALFFAAVVVGFGAEPGRVILQGHVPTVVSNLTPKGSLPATNTLPLAIGLPLRNKSELDELLRQLYDPRSANFRKFLTPQEFTARFGPTEQDYEAVKYFARTNGLAIIAMDANRLLLDVAGPASAVEKAFHITLRTYRHPTEARDFFAPDTEPTVDAALPVADIQGLSDYSKPHPKLRRRDATVVAPKAGSAPDGSGDYFGNDYRNAYAPGVILTGAGQMVGVLEFDGFYSNDIAAYATAAGNGRTNIVIQTVLLDGFSGTPTTGSDSGNDEVSLDIEMAMAMAPGLSRIVVFEGNPNNVLPNDILNSMLSFSNTVRNLSSSWGWSGGPSTTTDNIFESMEAVGQSFFNASGDSDAFTTGASSVNGVDNPNLDNAPSSSPYITQVGGTALTMNGTGASYASETVWNQNSRSGVGSSGGISSYYAIPGWQTNVSNMAGRGGSTGFRNIPDVAMDAGEDNYIIYGGAGQGSDGWGGTSFAAPLWAGFMALVNQQAAAAGNPPAGFINPAIYNIAAGANYASCFHDITIGSNTWRSSRNLFYATNGYDLCTGLGTPNGQNLINALGPYPYIITPPASQTATNGNNVTFGVTAGGQPPFSYNWLFNGTNLPAGGNVSGNTNSVLTLTSVTTANAGNYSVVVTNDYGSATSGVATLTVIFPPSFNTQPTNEAVVAGGNAVFSATVVGAAPLAYQWRENGTNLVNGGNTSGATSNTLTLITVTTTNAGNYTLVVTNLYGSATSSVATLTVLLPPAITVPPVAQTMQCGSNAAFSVTATGTPNLSYQWKLDSVAIAAATNTSLSLTNVHLPNHMVGVVVTNLYGSATSSVVLTVQDTLPPVITLNSTNPFYVELGSAFVDPGATAYDLCAGSVPVTVSGVVNTNAVSTNTIIYTATDGNGNTNTATRTVIVRDTTPPTILWSFTNLTLAAGTNCSAAMPNVTGTNFILAMDLSGVLNISQSPTNNATLPLGTNLVVITVADASGNTSYSTNQIMVVDETPPLILAQPQSQTNTIGKSMSFSVAATACTPLGFQWFFNNTALTAQTNGTLTLSNLTAAAAGNYSVVASASGGSTTSAVATLTVNLLASSVALASSENPTGFKDSVNFTAAVTPTNATGTIQFLTNGAAFDLEPLVAGTAVSTNISSLPRGTNVIAAAYSGDVNDLPTTNTFAQIVTNHPPVAAPAFYNRLAGYPLDIPVADLATNWSDPDGDTVSLAAIGVSTNGVTVVNDAGTLIYFNTNNVDDQFICTISDGWGGTNFETVNIAIVLTNTVPRIAGITSSSNGSVTLSLGGAPGYTYVLETTTNLVSSSGWAPAATNTLGTNSLWQFTDTQATNFSIRFYRLMLAP